MLAFDRTAAFALACGLIGCSGAGTVTQADAGAEDAGVEASASASICAPNEGTCSGDDQGSRCDDRGLARIDARCEARSLCVAGRCVAIAAQTGAPFADPPLERQSFASVAGE